MNNRVLLMVVVRSSTLPLRTRSSVVFFSCFGSAVGMSPTPPKLRSPLLPLPVLRLVFVCSKYVLDESNCGLGVGSSCRSPRSSGEEVCGGVELEEMRPPGFAYDMRRAEPRELRPDPERWW